jgi:hypothetical protein
LPLHIVGYSSDFFNLNKTNKQTNKQTTDLPNTRTLQDAKKNELSATVRRELQKVKTNVKLLTEMLQHFSPQSDGPLERSEVIQDLYR